MILIVSHQHDLTVDLGILALRERAVPYYRLNTERENTSLVLDETGYRCLGGPLEFELDRVSAVWLRKPNYFLVARQTQEPYREFVYDEAKAYWNNLYHLLEDRFWVNSPLMNQRATHRLYVLEQARRCGMSVLPTLITAELEKVRRFQVSHGELVAKSVGAGYRDDERGVASFTVHLPSLSTLEEGLGEAPVLFQKFVDKVYDWRVTVFGTRVLAVRIFSQQAESARVDWRQSEALLQMEEVALPREVEQGILALMLRLGLHFGALDFVEDHAGHLWFLEVNPNGQWGWIEQQIGLSLSHALVDLLCSRG